MCCCNMDAIKVYQQPLDNVQHMQDFDSAALRNKKHWNSFTTSFFLDLSDAMTQLQSGQQLDINVTKAESLLKQDLLCHICHEPMKNMPALKTHIHICKGSKH